MTIVFRPLSAPSLVDLGRAGVVRAAVGDVVGVLGRGAWRVEYLAPTGGESDDGRTEGGSGPATEVRPDCE